MPFLRFMVPLIFSLYAWIVECCRNIHITNSNFALARSCIFWIFFNSWNFAQFRTLRALRALRVFMPYVLLYFIKLLNATHLSALRVLLTQLCLCVLHAFFTRLGGLTYAPYIHTFYVLFVCLKKSLRLGL